FELPRTLCSTLFPYTTLFRSRCNVDHAGPAGEEVAGELRADRDERLAVALADEGVDPAQGGGGAGVGGGEDLRDHGVEQRAVARDRKSTRLNSSHVASSYAVF